MGSDLVLEIGALCDDREADAVCEHAVDERHAGVVVKGSQGTRWVRESAPELLHDAQRSGLQGAWLHYVEPHVNEPADEAVALMAAIGTLPLALGIWLELDPLPGADVMGLSEWLRALVDAVDSPRRPVALVLANELVPQLSQVTTGRRIVLTERDESGYVKGWAVRSDAELDLSKELAVPCYALSSTRGLVPAALSEPVAPPKPLSAFFPQPDQPDPPSEQDTPHEEPSEEEEHSSTEVPSFSTT